MAGYFLTGEETAALSPETVARRRKLLDALQQDAISTAPVQHWSQGAARIVNALANNFEEGRLNEAEKAGNARVAQFLAGQLGASVSPTPPPAAAGGSASPPAAAPNVSRETGLDAAASLINSESGGNWQAQNNAMGAGGMPGHFGRLQFGQARLQDAMNAGAIPQGTTPQQFMANPELQKAAEAWHFADIDKAIANGPAAAMIGKTINGIPVTQEGLRAVAHLGGTAGMNKFVQTNGAYNPADANGTTLSAYLQRHAGAGAAPAATAAAPSVPAAPRPSPALAAALADPWLSRNPIIQQMLAAQLGRNPVDDALKRVQLAQAQRELEQPKPVRLKINGEEGDYIRGPNGQWMPVAVAGGQTDSTPVPPGVNSAKYREEAARLAAKKAFEDQNKQDTALNIMPQIDRAEAAYRRLGELKAIGPLSASGTSRFVGGVFGAEAEKLRQDYEAAAKELELYKAQVQMKGQGQITENERRILALTLPRLDAADADTGLKTLSMLRQQMLKQSGGKPATAAPSTSAPQPAATVPGARKAADGNWYVPDPQRPGKYFKVEQ